MKKVVLHVGPSKTASTTVQKFLSEYEGSAECLYPRWGWTRPDAGHHNLAYEMRGDRRFVPELGGLDRLAKDMETGRSLFLSSEDFPIHAPSVQKVKDLSDAAGYELELLFFVRDPIARINSMYTQQIKTFVENSAFSDFAKRAQREDKLHLRSVVQAPLEKIGVNVRFLPFIGPKLNQIFSDMCVGYGFSATAEDFMHTNPAPSPEDIALYRQLGHLMKDSKVSHWEASNRFCKKYGFGGKYFGFDQWLIDSVRETLAPEYEDMKALGLGEYAEELEATFWKAKPKNTNISDQEKFRSFKADISAFMHL
ncbi:MAG: hypothetical protein COB08_004655 [Rhodobacteraceae bacterium]|nr:hypothetical protein [Paracoccaceae bacterium]